MTLSFFALFGLVMILGLLLGFFIYKCINKSKTTGDKDTVREQQYDDACNSLHVTINEITSETLVLKSGINERKEQFKKLRLQQKPGLRFFKSEDEMDTDPNPKIDPFDELSDNLSWYLLNYPSYNPEEKTLEYLVDFNLRYRAHHAILAELVAAYFKMIDEIIGNSAAAINESNTKFTV